MSGAGDMIVKRMTFPVASTIATTGGGVISLDSISSATVEQNPASEWASFAARYQQYRVRAVKLIAKAMNPVQSSTVIHGALYVGDYIGSSTPSSIAQVLSDESAKVFNTYSDWTYEVDWSRNPNAKLWNPTSAVIPTANLFGITFGSQAVPALSATTNYFALTIEYLVELRGSQ
jgi:hypothetical protein